MRTRHAGPLAAGLGLAAALGGCGSHAHAGPAPTTSPSTPAPTGTASAESGNSASSTPRPSATTPGSTSPASTTACNGQPATAALIHLTAGVVAGGAVTFRGTPVTLHCGAAGRTYAVASAPVESFQLPATAPVTDVRAGGTRARITAAALAKELPGDAGGQAIFAVVGPTEAPSGLTGLARP